MSCTYRRFGLIMVVLLLAAAWSWKLDAAPVQFIIDESQSSIALSGKVLGNDLHEQGPGSLITHFYGTIVAEVSATGIRFTGGSMLTARTNGVWKPGPGGASGSAPAAYAAQASTILGSVKGALRNVVLDLTSSVLPITDGRFDAAALLFAFPADSTASFDYDAGPLLGSDGIALSGASTNKIVNGATLETTAGGQKLVISVDTEFKFTALVENDSSVRLTGTLVAMSGAEVRITAIEIKDQSVILHVQNAGANPTLFSSTDLKQWTQRTPAQSTDANGVVLTLPKGGAIEFYRVAK